MTEEHRTAPPTVEEMRTARRVHRGYLPPLTADEQAALDARPVEERTVADFRRTRRTT